MISKHYFVRDGHVEDADITFHAHILDGFKTEFGLAQLGMRSVQFTFLGMSAHSAMSPWEGCDALDAAVLMDVGMAQSRQFNLLTAARTGRRRQQRARSISGRYSRRIEPQHQNMSNGIAAPTAILVRAPRLRTKESKDFLAEHVGIDDGESVPALGHHPEFPVRKTIGECLRACPRNEDVVARRCVSIGNKPPITLLYHGDAASPPS